MMNKHSVVIEIIKDHFYFSIALDEKFKNSWNEKYQYFTTDDFFVYIRFFEDFGPLCLSAVYKYCKLVKKKMKQTSSLSSKRIVHYTSQYLDNGEENKANAAFLVGAFMILELKKSPKDIFEKLTFGDKVNYVHFRDASYGPSIYDLPLYDCLNGFHKAVKHQFFCMKKFNLAEYEYYEKVENGDFNWIVPDKFLAFCGPHSIARQDKGHIQHTVDSYIDYFKSHNITNVVQLNRKSYDGNLFHAQGIKHHDLYFPDGTSPNDNIMRKFNKICEIAAGAIAVHCKAGLGRTGTLISCYLMKHFHFSANESIAWLRIARPGSIIGPQQQFLQSKEKELWLEGEAYKRNLNKKVETLDTSNEDANTQNIASEDECFSQGDQLNMIKQARLSCSITNRSKNNISSIGVAPKNFHLKKLKCLRKPILISSLKSVRSIKKNKSLRTSKIVTRSQKT